MTEHLLLPSTTGDGPYYPVNIPKTDEELVIERDHELAANLAFLQDQRDPRWLHKKTRKVGVSNKNKPGRKPEHTEALLINAEIVELKTATPSEAAEILTGTNEAGSVPKPE